MLVDDDLIVMFLKTKEIEQPTWNFGKALELSNQMCLEILKFLTESVLTLWWQ